jgi:hypothetical protein
MNQPPQTGKRIVSKSEYVARRTKKSVLQLSTAGGICVALFCVIAAVCFLFGLVVVFVDVAFGNRDARIGSEGGGALISCFSCLLIFVVVAYVSGKIAERSNELSAKEEAVIPLTRANTADLSAPDSLVRASAEPVQEQQAVLLRAATETQEKHEEQLVRASEGAEQA